MSKYNRCDLCKTFRTEDEHGMISVGVNQHLCQDCYHKIFDEANKK